MKFSSFLVEKRYLVITMMLILTFISSLMMSQVNINEDMTNYLPDDSSMKIGLTIMNEEFPTISDESSSFKMMFESLISEEKGQIYQELVETEGVSRVDYEINNDTYNKDKYTLYVIHVNAIDSSAKSKEIFDSLVSQYRSNYTIYTAGEIVEANETILDVIIPVAGVILIVILVIMCSSWFEPVLFIFTIGIAIVINMGTNALLPSVSDMTYSIAAILQLCLSMDYSIILMDRYRQEKAHLANGNRKEAMKNAIVNSFKSITSSSVTTIVGLLALVFMSFKIGFDMGIVLAKGVFISLICIFTILPTLILLTDKILEKSVKKPLLFFKKTSKEGVEHA